MNRVVERLEVLRNRKGWSKYRLAKESDIPYSSLNNLYLRQTEPTLYTLRKLCSGLQISVVDFFSDETPPVEHNYTPEEIDLIIEFRAADTLNQAMIKAFIQGLRHSVTFI